MKRIVEERPLAVAGVRFGGVACGIKPSGAPDCGVVLFDSAATLGGAFTRNRFSAAPVGLARAAAARGMVRALVVNSGNANACTGPAGVRDAKRACALVERLGGLPAGAAVPASTGVIGVRLPWDRLEVGIRRAVADASPDGLWRFTRAIMTTDAFPKVSSRGVRLGGQDVEVVGVAKGAGMIAPDMATLLVFLFTDATLPAAAANSIARAVARGAFNGLSVDGDTSTNDSLFVVATGARGLKPARGRDLASLTDAFVAVGCDLALQVAQDGEGATRVVRIEVSGARSDAIARRAARAVSRSVLVRSAFHGGDPNWGRIACALGYSGAAFDPDEVVLRVAGCTIFRRGGGQPSGVTEATRRLRDLDEVLLEVRLGTGPGRAAVLTTDLSPEYVRFNSAYTT